MKTQKFALLIALLSLLFLGACTDKDKDVKPDKKALVSEKTWKPNEAYVDGQSATSYAPVILTWRLKFNNDGTYSIVSSTGQVSGVWELNSDQTKLIMDKSSEDESTWDIQTLEKGKLNMKYQDADGSMELKMVHAN